MFVKNTLLISRTLGYAAQKRGAYLIISAVVWGSIPHVIFCFWLAKVLSHKVHMKSLQSPYGVPRDYSNVWGSVTYSVLVHKDETQENN